MWYEIIPCVTIMLGAYAVGTVAFPVTRYLLVGKPASRFVYDGADTDQYRRDARLDPTGKGNGSLVNYFEVIPDLPESEKQTL